MTSQQSDSFPSFTIFNQKEKKYQMNSSLDLKPTKRPQKICKLRKVKGFKLKRQTNQKFKNNSFYDKKALSIYHDADNCSMDSLQDFTQSECSEYNPNKFIQIDNIFKNPFSEDSNEFEFDKLNDNFSLFSSHELQSIFQTFALL